MKKRILAALLVFVALLTGCNRKETPGQWPSQKIEIDVCYTAGGTADTVARQLSALMSQQLSTTFNLVNVTGGSGSIAGQQVYAAAHDGYTWLGDVAHTVSGWRTLGYADLGWEDFYGFYAASSPYVLFVSGNSPYQTAQQLFDAMRYSLLAGGKRLRPVLAQAFCELCGGSAMDALPFAAAVEMVHTYSLIHDDLPCMDNDDYRRGRLTNHKVYGETTAVLAGDALLTAAFGHLAAAPLPASRVVKATRVLSLCAGELGMVGGQVLDMEAEHRVCTEEEVLAIQSRKTGALISAACQLGVIAAGGSPAQQQAAADYAASLGLAFQIEDDILDVVGDAAKLGKATGMDQNKNTFVRLHGVEACRARITEETQRAVAALAPLGQAEFLTELAQRLTSRDH